jgi:hypothetical protein
VTVVQCALSNDLQELVDRAQAVFDALTPSQKLRHRYMQRRSFARSFGPGDVDKRMPHESTLTDTQIGLILIGEQWA